MPGWFVVKIRGTVVYSGVTAHTFDEWHLRGTGLWVEKGGGRKGEALNPGVPLNGTAFQAGDFALARPADGAGNNVFELLPVAAAPSLVDVRVCPVFTGPNVTGIIVEKTYSDGSQECETDPADCCDSNPGYTTAGWYCVEGTGCTNYAADPGAGPVLLSGPYASEALCDAGCGEPPPVSTSCCADPLPATLTATVTNKTGDCTCVSNSFTLTNSGGSQWFPDSPPNGCDTSGCLYLECSGGTWSFSTDSCITTPATLVSVSCDPFEVVFDVTAATDLCTGSFRVTITE